jgi:glycosyltransferase involved in cell wall biosynthesis
MYKDHSIAVVMPAHNEERFVGDVIRTMPSLVDSIIVVDDCSIDRTADAARSTGDPRLTVIRTETNSGVGGAMKAGYRHALGSDADIIVKMDADGQMSGDDLPKLLDGIIEGGGDYAKGNRFLTHSVLSVMPRTRLFGNIVLTFMTKLASGYWHIFDPQNGFTAVRSEVLRNVELNRIHQGYFFENDMLAQLYLLRARVVDVDIPARYGDEESGVRVFRVASSFPFLFFGKFVRRIYDRYILRDFSPIALFLLLGAILFLWGAGFGGYIWLKSFLTGELTKTGTIMLALLPLILGFQLLLQGLVLDIQETPR